VVGAAVQGFLCYPYLMRRGMNLQSFMKSGSRFVGFCPLFLTVLVVVYFVDWFSSCFVGWCIAKWLAFQIILFDSDRSNMLAD
jgi:hypothetical protein